MPATAAAGVRVGVSGECPKCEVTALCAGEAGGKTDVWSISTQARTVNGEEIPPGQPYNDVKGF
jgi:hypothetical protein